MNRPIERQGVFAEFVSTPDQIIYEIPKGLDKNEAPVAEPTAVSLHAVLIGEESLKKPLSECRTLVQGGGAIGLLCGLILSRIKGNKNIVVSTATAGNHGRSVAWRAKKLGLKCKIFISEYVTDARGKAMEELEAEVLPQTDQIVEAINNLSEF